jgi:hypothetical protein
VLSYLLELEENPIRQPTRVIRNVGQQNAQEPIYGIGKCTG